MILNILGKRTDGFHELETVMHPVALQDTLTFELETLPGITLTCSHPDLPTDATNLVYCAARTFLQTLGLNAGVRIHLDKRVPLAAGLGGGSSNAATTLLALNDLFNHPAGTDLLHRLATALGSDVPFFLQSSPAMATGRGEQITALERFPTLEGAFVLLIHPGFGVSTAWAYQALAQFPAALNGEKGRAEKLIESFRHLALGEAAAFLYNSLEAPVLQKYPVLQLYQDFLRANGAPATMMSGSGSTTFALFQDETEAARAAERFASQFGKSCWTAVAPLG